MSCSTTGMENSDRRTRGYLGPTEETEALWRELEALREQLRQGQGNTIGIRIEVGRLTQEIWRLSRERRQGARQEPL